MSKPNSGLFPTNIKNKAYNKNTEQERKSADAKPNSQKDSNSLPVVEENKYNHVFKEKHNLEELVKTFNGNEETLMNTVQKEVQDYINKHNINNKIYECDVSINGFVLTIRGKVLNGVARVGTCFIKNKGKGTK